MKKVVERAGARYGRLIVLHESKRNDVCAWLCVCDCGAQTVVVGNALRQGRTRSCGCLGEENRLAVITKHGFSKTPEYHTYRRMMARCTNVTDKSYKNYGGRGIKVCDRWHRKPENFLLDMGVRPANGSLDRIDNNGPYSPENCRWRTRTQQNRNSRRNTLITFHGKTMCISEWAEFLGINPYIISSRLSRGFSSSRALTQPIRTIVDGRTVSSPIKDVPEVNPDAVFVDEGR